MKKIILLLTAFLLFACGSNEKTDDSANNVEAAGKTAEESAKENEKESGKIAEEINVLNAEIDHNNNLVYITFSDAVITEEKKGDVINENLFVFTPNTIEGKTFWAENNKLVYQISKIEDSKQYNAEFISQNLSKLTDKKIKEESYKFNLKMEKLKVENISLNYKADGKINTRLTGTIDFNKTFKKEKILEDITLKLSDKPIRIALSSVENNRLYFESEYVSLEDGEYDLALKIDIKNSGLQKAINYTDKLVLNRNFLLQEAIAEEKNDRFKIYLTLSRNIMAEQDLKSFIHISDMNNFEVKADKNKIIIHGNFSAAKEYDVKLFSGLRSTDNYSLPTSYAKKVKMPDLSPQLEFINKGIYLSKAKNNTFRFKSRNLKSVYIGIKKIYEQNIYDFIKQNNIPSTKTSSQRIYGTQIVQFGTEVYGKKYSVSHEQNKWSTTDIDLSQILNEYNKSGMYIIEISYSREDLTSEINDYPYKKYDVNNKNFYYLTDYIYRNGHIIKPLIISDLGVIAKKTKDSLYVFTDSISEGKSINNASVTVYGNKGKIEKGTSNENGVAKINWKEKFQYIEVEANGEKSYVFANDKNLQNYTLMDNEGLVKPEGIDVFSYTERGVYRPGDDIYITAILRENLKKLPEEIPLNLKLYTPLNKLYTEKLNLEGKNGLYSFKLKTELNDQTGNWKASYFVGEEKIKDVFIKVETVVPPKIKAELDGKVENNVNYALSIRSDYLFGEPAAGLKTKTNFSIKPSSYVFKKYRNFEFKNNLSSFDEIKSSTYEKTLNNSGKAYIDYSLPDFRVAPYKMDIFSTVEIFQKDGRKITKKLKSTYDINDKYVGLEKLDTDYLKLGSDIELATVLLSKDGEKLPNEDLRFAIYKNEYYWWWDYHSIDDFKRNFKKDNNTILIDDGKLVSGEKLKYRFNDYGNYYVEVSASNGHSAGYFVSTSYWGKNTDSKSASIIDLSSDKAEYAPGDQAEILFDSPDSGYALITIEKNNKIIDSFKQKLDSEKTKVKIDITEEMIPNVYVNINMIQDLKTIDNDRPVRLRGLKSLKVVNETSKIDFDMTVADELQANEDFTVEVQTKDSKKAYFTIAVVDEGVLGLTNYKTPNPTNYFYGKEKNQIITYDMYDDILGLNNTNADLILKPGGGVEMMAKSAMFDEFRGKQESGNQAVKRFKVLSLYEGPIETDENGYAKVNFTMGDYTGAVRVMAVAVRDGAYISKEKTVPVKTPIILNAGMPRTLAPNDLFYSDLNLFFMEDDNGKAEVSLELEGPAKILGDSKFIIEDAEKGEQNFKFKIKVVNKTGKLKATFKVETKEHSIEKVIDIAVNSPAPYVYLSKDYEFDTEEKLKLNIHAEDVIGTSHAKVTVSKVPRYNLDQRIKWLIRYPYGCIEQTVSSVFPQLYMDKVMRVNQDDWKEIDENVNAAIARLQKFQLQNGGMSYWQNENYISEWGSIYALHFLIEAREVGYFVPKDMIDNLKNYLYDQAARKRDRNLTSFYRLYVLALSKRANISAMNYYKQSQLKSMSNTEKYLLATSYILVDETNAANEILASASTNVSSRNDWGRNFGSRLRDTAIILEAYTLLDKDEESEEIFHEVIEALQDDNWYSTQTLAYALMAVSKYSEVKQTKGSIKLKFKSEEDEEWAEITTDKEEAVIELSDLLGKSIEFENISEQKLYIAYQWEGKQDIKSQPAHNFNHKINLQKNYYTNEGKLIRNLENIKRGDSFWIIYEVSKDYYDKYENMALVQNLASGLEIENIRLSQSDYPEWMQNRYYNINQARYTDIRDDKIMWFFDARNYQDVQVFATKVNAVTEGVFYMPGAIAEHMYYDYIGDAVRGEQVIIK